MCFPNVYLRMRIAMLHDVILVWPIIDQFGHFFKLVWPARFQTIWQPCFRLVSGTFKE